MQIFDVNKNRIGILTGFKDRSITITLDSGDKEMSFQYPATAALVNDLKEECYIRTKTDEYVLKEINEADDFNTYTATLNVEELESKVFKTGFETVEKTIMECLQIAFEGTGWSIRNCEVTKKRTIRESDQQTAWSVLQKALSTYRCECVIDTLQKKIDIYDRIGEDKGAYFIEGLNLKKMTRKSDTYDFYTRIYPIGKDGLTPETVLGKDYIDNHQYSSKLKACVWKDERYTVVDSLIEDATAKLAEISKPYRQYTAEVQDLAKQSEVYKDILTYGIGDTVTIISKSKGIKDKQRIVKIVEYPETPEKNTVELSNVNKTFAEIQQEEVDAETDRATTEEGNLSDDIADEAETRQDEDSKITVRVEKTEKSIETEVADRSRQNLEIATKISQLPHKLSLQATGGEKTVGITIQLYDGNGNLIDTTSGAANIMITGFVTFNDLANAGSTTINGANITTGVIKSADSEFTRATFYEGINYGFRWNGTDYRYGIISVPSLGTLQIGGSDMHTEFPGSVQVQGLLYSGSLSSSNRVAVQGDLRFDNLNYTDTGHGNVKGPDSSHNLATTSWVSSNFQKSGSDKRLKTDFADMPDIEYLYMQLDPVKYKFKDGLRGYDDRVHYGFIAQDVEQIVKGLGFSDLSLVYKEQCDSDLSNEAEIIGDQYVYRLNKDELHAMHVQMIQKQKKEIEQLKLKNWIQTTELEMLKKRVEMLEEKLC